MSSAGIASAGIRLRASRAVAAGALTAFLLQFGGAGLKYLVHVVLARWLGAAEFGRYAYVLAWGHLLMVLGGVGLSMAVLRFLPEYLVRRDWDGAAGLIAGSRRLTLAGGAIAAAVYLAIAHLLGGAAYQTGVLLLVPMLAAMTLQGELLRSLGRIDLAYFPTLIGQQVLAIAVVLGILTWVGTITGAQAILAQGIAALVIVAVQVPLLRSVLPAAVVHARPRFEPSRWLAVSFPMFLATLFTVMLGQTDVLLVGTLRSSVDAGFYSAASRTAALVGLALVAANAVVAPMIASCHSQGDIAGLRRIVRSGTRIAFAGSLVLTVALVLFGRQVLALFGPEYAGAYAPLLVLCAGQVISAAVGPVGYLLSLTGHEREAARVYGICAVANVAASVVLTSRWGLTGAALATAGSMVAWNVWLRLLVRDRLRMGGFLLARAEAA